MLNQRNFGSFLKLDLPTSNAFGLELPRARHLGFTHGEILCPEDPSEACAHQVLNIFSESDLTLHAVHAELPGTIYTTRRKAITLNGLTPRHTRENRLSVLFKTAKFAKAAGATILVYHPGHFDWNNFEEMLKVHGDVLKRVFDETGLRTGFETGSLARDVNAAFLAELDSQGLCPIQNVDPANLILYGVANSADEVHAHTEAVFKVLTGNQVTMHVKDASPGSFQWRDSWFGASEQAIGQGVVDWDRHFELFDRYSSNAVVMFEREVGDQENKEREIREASYFIARKMVTASS